MADMTGEDFLRIYKKLPEREKEMPICVVGGETYCWCGVNGEVKGNTKISKRMLKQISRTLRWTKQDKKKEMKRK